MKTKALAKICDTLVRDFAKEMSEFSVSYDENKKEASWTIPLRLITIQFIYTKRKSLYIPASTLYCILYPRKNSDIYLHIPQLIEYLDLNDFHSYYFPFIENEDRMKACFNKLSGFIKQNLEKINDLALGDGSFAEHYMEEFKFICDISDDDIPKDIEDRRAYLSWMMDFLSDNIVFRNTTFDAYDYFLRGEYEKALKAYEKQAKKDRLLFYEEKLVEFIRKLKSSGEAYEAVSPECASVLDVKEYSDTSKSSKKAFILSMLLCWGVLTIPVAIIMTVIYVYYSNTTILHDFPSPIFSPVFSLLPAVFWGIAFCDKLQYLISKDKRAVKDFGDLINPQKSLKFAKIFAVLVTVFSLVYFSATFHPYVKCYDDYMIVADDEFSANYERLEYRDIKGVYHVDGCYNDYGDYIEREAYILQFDNKNVDLDMVFSEEDIKNVLLPLFDGYYDTVHYIHTERDIK